MERPRKKDIGQSPLQVAIKCRHFDIIDILLAHGANVNFMENPDVVPPHSTCMPVLHDAIIGAMDSLLYEKYEDSKNYVQCIKQLLEKGADFEKWLNADSGGDESNRAAYLDAFIPKEDKTLEMKFHGRTIKSIIQGDIDQNQEIRQALQEYFQP